MMHHYYVDLSRDPKELLEEGDATAILAYVGAYLMLHHDDPDAVEAIFELASALAEDGDEEEDAADAVEFTPDPALTRAVNIPITVVDNTTATSARHIDLRDFGTGWDKARG